MTENQEIGARIRELRIKNNLTQQQLADRLQYKSRSTINKIELGINEIHPTKLRGFAHALNSSVEFILGWEKDSNIYDNKVNICLADGTTINYTFSNEKIDRILDFIHSVEQE